MEDGCPSALVDLPTMKLRPLILIVAMAAFFAALARKRVEEAKPADTWEPVTYS